MRQPNDDQLCTENVHINMGIGTTLGPIGNTGERCVKATSEQGVSKECQGCRVGL